MSTDLKSTQEVMTVQGTKLLIKCSARRLRRWGRSLHGLRPSAHLPRNTRAVADIIDDVLLAFKLTQSSVIFSTWVAAAVAGDLVETLSSPGPFTVFAPTEDAFAPLPEGSLASWLLPREHGHLGGHLDLPCDR